MAKTERKFWQVGSSTVPWGLSVHGRKYPPSHPGRDVSRCRFGGKVLKSGKYQKKNIKIFENWDSKILNICKRGEIKGKKVGVCGE
jgi:hypothetical protein